MQAAKKQIIFKSLWLPSYFYHKILYFPASFAHWGISI